MLVYNSNNFIEWLDGPNTDAYFPSLETGTGIVGVSATGYVITNGEGNMLASTSNYLAAKQGTITTYYPVITDVNISGTNSVSFILNGWQTAYFKQNIAVAVHIRLTPSNPLGYGLLMYYNGSPCSSLMMTPEYDNNMMIFCGLMSLFGENQSNHPDGSVNQIQLELRVVAVEFTTGQISQISEQQVSIQGCISILLN